MKWRDWKYHLLWQPDAEKPVEKPARPYVFNIVVDPREESPRNFFGQSTHMEDWWIIAPIRKVIADMEKSLAAYPPVPLGAPLDYMPKATGS